MGEAEPSFWAKLIDYGWQIWSSRDALISMIAGVVLGLARLVEMFWNGLHNTFNVLLRPHIRQPLMAVGAFVGVFFAGFLAYDQQSTELRKERTAVADRTWERDQARKAAGLPALLHIKEVTAGPTYTVGEYEDRIDVNLPAPGPMTINLPTTFPAGRKITIKDKGHTAFKQHIRIVAENGPIEGQPFLEITDEAGSWSLTWNGKEWGF